MTPLRVEIWADVVCPWCWLGEAALLRAVDDLGAGDRIRIEMRAFRLDPDPDPERSRRSSTRSSAPHVTPTT
jgi:predicted DsbA family dithiol-disulfide isomerase